jgi:AcrR family transcriptional regulator
MAASRPPARRVRLQVDERRSQIIAAALDLFARRPYSEVSTSELAEAAGVTRANLHYHFGTKRELYIEVVRQFTRLPPPPFAPGSALSVGEQIDVTVTRWLDGVWRARSTYLTVFRTGTMGNDPEVEAILDESREAWADRLAELLPFPGDHADPQVRALIRAYQALAEDAVDEWLRRGRLTRAQVQLVLTRFLTTLLEDVAPAALELGARERP